MSISALFKILCLCPVATRGLQAFTSTPPPGDLQTVEVSEAVENQAESHSRDTVWIIGFMRTASSTILSMISATQDDNMDGEKEVFSLFEPCHHRDQYAARLSKLKPDEAYGCAELVQSLTRCDFSEVHNLWGWDNPHTSNNHEKKYSKEVAEAMCKKSHHIAIKTVGACLTFQGPEWNITGILNKNPHLKVIEVLRDPRGIYASKEKMHDGKDAYTPDHLDADCEAMAANLDVKHENIHRVVFDDLVKDPRGVSKRVYNFLGRSWGEEQEAWVKGTFNADCASDDNTTGLKGESTYHDCHSDSSAVAKKWKKDLTSSIKKRFKENENCVRVAKAYRLEM